METYKQYLKTGKKPPPPEEYDDLPKDREYIERNTRGQALNHNWFAWRYGRVSGSICADILHTYDLGFQGNAHDARKRLANNILHPRPIHGTALDWGKDKEKVALVDYLDDAEVDPTTMNSECGFCVHKKYDYIGVSPDGVVDGKRLLEIKCPYSKRHVEDFYTSNELKSFYLQRMRGEHAEEGDPDVMVLDRSTPSGRKYYYQIQLSLSVLDLKDSHLYVWTPNGKVLLTISRQHHKLEELMHLQLENFWLDYVFNNINFKKYRRVNGE
ncbi:hypothetical protein CAPTEDRAFT_214458 [Capitella teleta]|uniref:YqaJ viral recombinase domain-containing protein n=1 Tax=Capitella teleta TaxID=283909 RepID=R7UYJ7_CAPTE|nr:hypothetical protein CAPTEDRAFT_214458 [Capitella teleta]|eukprot:ELU09007.1 hypothetical protein CAPTEDRAFT_214458 [Capitella teleta]